MDKRDLCELLSALDRELRSDLEYGAERATRDVDAIVRSGDVQEFRRAVRTVGATYDLPEDWVSDAVKGYADILPPDYAERTRSVGLAGSRLHLVVAGLPELVAMKIVALREQDLRDLDLLLPQMTELDRERLISIMDRLNPIRSDWALRIQYFLEEIGWKIQ